MAPDLSSVRAGDARHLSNVPVVGKLISDVNFEELCEMNLNDRRSWAIILAAAGGLTLAGAIVFLARARNNKSTS